MDSKEFISSGILELYALGACSTEEVREVEYMAAKHAEVKAELDSVLNALGNYALSDETPPPPYLKEKISKAIFSARVREEKPGAKVIRLSNDTENSNASSSRVFKMLAAAAIALLIMSSIMNYHFHSQVEETQDELTSLRNEKMIMQGEIEVQKNNYALIQKKMNTWKADMELLKKPTLVPMEMKGMPVAPDAKAMVYLDTKTNDVYLEVGQLPKAPDGMQYQLWAIVKGKPVNAGMIEICQEPDTCGIHKMSTIDAHAFAISLEKSGGSQDAPKGSIYAAFGI